MKPSTLYRISGALLVLFAVGHTLGFTNTTGLVGADTVVGLMKSVRFPIQGFERSYWNFFVGFGLVETVFLLFAAGLSWSLARTPREVRAQIPAATWGLAICFLAVTILSWGYFFVIPGVFATLITACLGIAAAIDRG
jgi:Kef-type K+ transport system membrane component KefB